VSDHTGTEWRPDAPGVISEERFTVSNSRLSSYRAAVGDLVREADTRLRPCDPLSAESLVAEHLGRPEFAAVLSRVEGGVDAVAARVTREIGNYQPSTRSSASNLPTFIRILLLSQIDAMWWSGVTPFVSDGDVLGSGELVDLSPLRSAKMLQFQYRTQTTRLPGRARDWARRQALPAFRPRTAGLRFTRSRPEVIVVVNQIARELAAALPPRSPQLWVTSMARSVEHQHRLRSLGYAAVLPSSHCVGFACDVEMDWFRRFDRDNLLARLLLERQEAGQLNVIDEGQAWHLCVNPLACDELLAVYDAQLADR
jgi:hypothetical protein